MHIIREQLKNIAFFLLDKRKQRGFHLMNDLRYWSRKHPIRMIFDVGANIGQTVMLSRRYFPDAHIEAFEPIRATFRILQDNCAKLENVSLSRFALGANREIRTIALRGNSCLNSLLNSAQDGVSENIESVEIWPLDQVCQRKSITHIGLLKTDTEGFDLEVLLGAQCMIQSKRIDFILSEVSFDPEKKAQTYFSPVNEFLYTYQYRLVGFYDLAHEFGDKPSLSWCNVLYASSNVSE